jgi:hypothetical protein
VANPYAPPTGSGSAPFAPTGQGRGGCLTAFLVMMMVANSLSAMGYFFMRDMIRSQPPHPSAAMILVLGLASVANIAFTVAVWRWKKWGVYGFLGISILAFIANLQMGVAVFQLAFGLVGPIILFLLVRPRWSHFT